MSDSIAFLISDVARLMRRRFDERARLLGVTRAQWKVLFTLGRQQGLNQGALAERLEVEPITLCRMIDRLADAGLVERRHDPDDRRAWLIFLTDRAHPIIAELRALADELFESAVSNVSKPDLDGMSASLKVIHSNLSTLPSVEQVQHG